MKRLQFLSVKLQLHYAALKAGCCREYRIAILKAKSKDELLSIYKDGVLFCVRRNYPSEDFIKKHFQKTSLNNKGIFIDDDICDNRPVRHRKIILLGDCHGSLLFSNFCSNRIVIAGNSEVNIIADEHAFLLIQIFNDARVTVNAKNGTRVVVKYYDDVSIPKINNEGNAIIKVIQK